MIRIFYKLWEVFIQLVFPLRCPICDKIVTPYGEKICISCFKGIKYVTAPWCMKCGKKMDADGEYCLDCSKKKYSFNRGRTLFEYDSIAEGLYRFKYANRQEYALFYGEQLAKYLGAFIKEINADAIIPVPLHRRRYRKRGYNQSWLIAKELGKRLKIPVMTNIVYRVRNTVPLKKLNPAERENNLKKAFKIRQNVVKLNTIIIIDDIYTTGSTIDEISKVLKEKGVQNIYFVTLACGNGV